MDAFDTKETEELIEALMLLKSKKEARMFLRDLLTDQELLEFGRRWKVARMLEEKVPYSQIVNDTGLSTTTVARISKWMQEGAGGYELMLKKFSGARSQKKTKGRPLHPRS